MELPGTWAGWGRSQVRLVRAIITCQSRWHCTVSAWMGVTFGGFSHYIEGFVAASTESSHYQQVWETDFLMSWKCLKSQKVSSSLYTKQNMERKIALIHTFAINHSSKSKSLAFRHCDMLQKGDSVNCKACKSSVNTPSHHQSIKIGPSLNSKQQVAAKIKAVCKREKREFSLRCRRCQRQIKAFALLQGQN